MLILTLRTEQPQAYIGLWDGAVKLGDREWLADRQLAETLHQEIRQLLLSQNHSMQDIDGIVVFEGPGSFTGLRIGISVANGLSYSLNCPIVGSQDDSWQNAGIIRLQNNENDTQILPFYGAEPNITAQKK